MSLTRPTGANLISDRLEPDQEADSASVQERFNNSDQRSRHEIGEENALHLRLSTSSESNSQQPSAGDAVLSSSDPGPSSLNPIHSPLSQTNPENALSQTGGIVSTQTPPRVHFRSRVRIASGRLSHYRSQSQSQAQSQSLRTTQMAGHPPLVVRARRESSSHHSDFESGDSSPSSSISAPLRSTPEPHERMRSHASFLYPSSARKYRPKRNLRASNVSGSSNDEPGTIPPLIPSRSSDERAPLLRAPGSRLGARTRRLYGLPDDEASENARAQRRAQRLQEIKESFGPWPWRLFNGYVS